MPRSEERRLRDILQAAMAVSSFLEGWSQENFSNDIMVQSAVLYQLVIVGEATAALSLELRDRHPHMPWGAITGFRNRVVHGYHDVDWRIVWDTATIDLPVLVRDVAAILDQDWHLTGRDDREPVQ
jgi:uncharacterized protein with HEPN domain